MKTIKEFVINARLANIGGEVYINVSDLDKCLRDNGIELSGLQTFLEEFDVTHEN